MKARIYIVLLLIIATALPSVAQQQHSLQIDDGSGNVDLINASGTGSNFTFPAGDGTIITNNNVGSYAWATNGVSLTGALPGNPVEYFGSVNGGDVIMKAYNTEQLRLLSTGGLQLPTTSAAGAGTFFQGPNRIMHTYGSNNFFAGANAGNVSMTGANNAACGASSLSGNTSGSGNTASGNDAGNANTTGSENTFIGHGANASAGNFSNATAIGSGAVVGQSNSIVLGNNASVGIGTPTPSQKLEVNGNILANGIGTGNITGTGTIGGNVVNSTTSITAGGTIGGNVVNSTTTMTAGGTIAGNVVNATTTMTAGGTVTGNVVNSTTTMTAGGTIAGNVVNSTTTMTAGGTIAGNVVNATTTMTAGGTVTGNVVNSTTTMTAGGTITGNDIVSNTTVTATGMVNILGQNGLHIVEGANAMMGVATLAAGAVAVNSTKVTVNSRIYLTHQNDGGNPANLGILYVSNQVAGAFTINSTNGADVSTIAWVIIEP